MSNVRNSIAGLQTEAAGWRHVLHENPGTKYEETEAARLIVEKLKEWGIIFEDGIAETGIVATIEGQQSDGQTIGLRADMDALNMTEASGQPWASKIDGKMHGCGHDGHTATLLGVAKYLSENPDFKGKVHLIFQPAEEGGRGADRMIEEGVLDRYPCDEMYAMHNWPWLPLGEAAIASGPILAAVDSFEVKVEGVAGHPGIPDKVINPVFIAARIATGIEDLMNKFSTPESPVSFHPGFMLSSSDQENVVGQSVKMGGTLRTFDEDIRAELKKALTVICEDIAKDYRLGPADNPHQAKITLEYTEGTDVTYNASAQAAFAAAAAQKVLGPDNVHEFSPMLGGEDFGSFTRAVPGAMIALGQGVSDEPDSPHNRGLHDTQYDFNDGLLPPAIEYFVTLVQGRLPLHAEDKLELPTLDFLE